MANLSARERLIVALDVPSVADASALVQRLGDAVTFYKVGLELAMNGGLDYARELVAARKQVFLDMKLLDIENTVERAVRNVAQMGVTFLTVHGHDSKTLCAAVAGKSGTDLKILAVTVLTNLDADDLQEQGIAGAPSEIAARRAKIARDAGCDGIVASGLEARRIRSVIGPDIAIVTPGIRLPGDDVGDQVRVLSPQQAIAGGADYLVVGRPINAAADPRLAADAFVLAIEEALAARSLGSAG